MPDELILPIPPMPQEIRDAVNNETLAVFVGAGGLGPVGHVVPYEDLNLTVEPLSTKTLTINMSEGAVFEGYLTVRGGNDDVRFYIEDSFGNRVLDINRVNGRYDFSYVTTSEGFHTVYFDNSFSVITSKQVYIHYRVR